MSAAGKVGHDSRSRARAVYSSLGTGEVSPLERVLVGGHFALVMAGCGVEIRRQADVRLYSLYRGASGIQQDERGAGRKDVRIQ